MADDKLPSGWRSVKLGDLGEVNRGRSRYRPRYAEHLYGGPYPFVQTGDIKESGGRITAYKQTYSEAGLAQSRLWPAGTMCITIAANIAETGILTFPACFPDSVVGFVADQSKCDARFIEYTFRHLKSRIQHEASGSVQDNINLGTLERLRFPLPPLEEQRAIAHVLGTLDDKIELNRKMNETLEAMARALFKSWFVDFDPVRAKAEGRDPGLPKQLADLFPASLEDSELGEIPRGWRTGSLALVAENPRRGIQPSAVPPSTPYIGLEHMPRRSIALSEWGEASSVESNKSGFRRGQILFGKLRPYFHKVGIAPIDGVCSTDIVVAKPKEQHWFGFVLAHMSSESFVEYTNAGSTGTKMPRTNWDEMSRYPVVLPPDSVAARFNSLTGPLIDRTVAGIHESKNLAASRDTLLPKLISGELCVSDPNRILRESV